MGSQGMNDTECEGQMTVSVNGEPRAVAAGCNLKELLIALRLDPARFGIAAAINSLLIERESWAETILKENDSIEIIRAFQGG